MPPPETSIPTVIASSRALDYLAEQGLLELKAEGVRLRYRRRKAPPDLGALADKLYDRAVAREHSELARLDDVVSLVMHNGCQVSRLRRALRRAAGRPLRALLLVPANDIAISSESSPSPPKSSDVAGPELSALSTPASGGAWISSK